MPSRCADRLLSLPLSRRGWAGVVVTMLLRDASAAEPLIIGRGEQRSAFASLAARITEEAFRRAGLKAEIRTFPLLRSIEMASSGEIDGDVSRTADITTRFPNLVALTVPPLQCDLAVYGRDPDLPRWSHAEIATSKTACITRGSVIARTYTQGMSVEEVTPGSASFDMLADGHCDVVVIVRLDAEKLISERGLDGIVRWPYLWATEPLYLILNRKHAALVPRMNRVLAEMASDGVIERYNREALEALGIAALKPLPAASR
jgi:polar amino acid transport system substrate-binding protein